MQKNRHSCEASRHPGLIFAGACHGQKTGTVTKICDTARTNLWACKQAMWARHCARSIGKIHWSEPELRNGKLCNECLLSWPGEILEAVEKSLSRINEHTIANVCLHLCFQLRIMYVKYIYFSPRGVLKKVLYGEATPRGPTPYPFIYIFFQKRYPFRIPFIGKRHPFHIPS